MQDIMNRIGEVVSQDEMCTSYNVIGKIRSACRILGVKAQGKRSCG
jgi:hypothetical protein